MEAPLDRREAAGVRFRKKDFERRENTLFAIGGWLRRTAIAPHINAVKTILHNFQEIFQIAGTFSKLLRKKFFLPATLSMPKQRVANGSRASTTSMTKSASETTLSTACTGRDGAASAAFFFWRSSCWRKIMIIHQIQISTTVCTAAYRVYTSTYDRLHVIHIIMCIL